jgi:hypothetical protein
MDFTMLKQMSRSCRLLAFLAQAGATNSEMDSFVNILELENIQNPMIKPLTDIQVAQHLNSGLAMESVDYSMILQYLNLKGHHGQYRDSSDYPHPEHALILPPNAKQPEEFHENGRTYSCYSSHKGNSFIQFYNRQIRGYQTGVIMKIWEIPLQGFLRKIIMVSPHHELNYSELEGTPYDERVFPRFMSKIVEVKPLPDILLIEPEHIITHLAAYKTSGIHGIEREIFLVCWALNRGRKEYVPS